MKPVVAIAMSGGIDSLVAAHLLKRQGWRTLGLHFITGFENRSVGTAADSPGMKNQESRNEVCQDVTADNIDHPVAHICEQLEMPVYIVDCRHLFRAKVVDYFCRTYEAGRTPNPCLVCNPAIKFGALLRFMSEKGATALATGHYARVIRDEDGRHHLLKGVDKRKDQSYFLSFLNQAQLARAVFPLGGMTKDQVRALAGENDLVPAVGEESQDVCFISGTGYGEFLARWGNLDMKPGPIENMDGKIIGEHKGLHLFTIGQRKGINCPAAEPYYVIRIDRPANRLIVGFRDHLSADECRVENINWIQEPTGSAFEAETRLRYRHQAAPATIIPRGDRGALVQFHKPQTAVTPGQGAVFYRGEEVLGGGWIST